MNKNVCEQIKKQKILKELNDYQVSKPVVLEERGKMELALVWRGDIYKKHRSSPKQK